MSRILHSLLTITFLFAPTFLFTQNNEAELYFLDPQQGFWSRVQGSIEEASIVAQPQGLYMEVDLTMTFAAEGYGYALEDTLEIVLDFNLPEKAIVTDSWLWIGEDIVRAKIADRWTAGQIYENIVNRRQDPSILYKNGKSQYQLRIFPMAGTESRKVKITYLVPFDWDKQSVRAALPTPIFHASQKLVNLELFVRTDNLWGIPSLTELPNAIFTPVTNEEGEIAYKTTIYNHINRTPHHLIFNSPMEEGVFISTYQEEEEAYYQLAILPSVAFDLPTKRKTAILVDFSAGNSPLNKEEVLQQLKNQLLNDYDERDEFALLLSGLETSYQTETWQKASAANINRAFENAAEELTSYSNLYTLLKDGIKFIQTQGGTGDLLLISNASGENDLTTINLRIDDLMDLMEERIPISVLDYQTLNRKYYNFGGRGYRGNEYFYTTLSNLTRGYYQHTVFYTNFTQIANELFQSLSGQISAFDLHTSLADGFTYGKYNLHNLDGLIPVDRPILQVGKYRGQFPFEIEVYGEYEDILFAENYEIPTTQIVPTHSSTRSIWAGNYVQNLERSSDAKETINEIIQTSISEHVLSLYTALICLEPAQGGEICEECNEDVFDDTDFDDDDIVIATEDTKASEKIHLEAFPNPFREQATIRLQLPKGLNSKELEVVLYDALGRVIQVFQVEDWQQQEDGSLQLTWNASANAAGIYYLIVRHEGEQQSLKLVKM